MIEQAREWLPPVWLWKVGGGLVAFLFARIGWKALKKKDKGGRR